jgi:hypothetical protein
MLKAITPNTRKMAAKDFMLVEKLETEESVSLFPAR